MIGVTLQVGLRKIEADGSNCIACQDAVYGIAYELYVHADGKSLGSLGGQFCQSCGDILNQETGEDRGQ